MPSLSSLIRSLFQENVAPHNKDCLYLLSLCNWKDDIFVKLYNQKPYQFSTKVPINIICLDAHIEPSSNLWSLLLQHCIIVLSCVRNYPRRRTNKHEFCNRVYYRMVVGRKKYCIELSTGQPFHAIAKAIWMLIIKTVYKHCTAPSMREISAQDAKYLLGFG